MEDMEGIAMQLRQQRDDIKQRLAALQREVQRHDEPLEADFAEQAVQRENDDVVDALQESAIVELRAIQNALARIESGDYGRCSQCGMDIPSARLKALPYTDRCIDCAE